MKQQKDYQSDFAKTVQVPSKPWLLPLHAHEHVVVVDLWRKRAIEHNVSTSDINQQNKKQIKKKEQNFASDTCKYSVHKTKAIMDAGYDIL